MSDINNTNGMKKKGIRGFFRRTWKAVKRPFQRGNKTKVEPIVPPLRPDPYPSDPDLTSVPCTSNLEHRLEGEQIASEPLLITDLTRPDQTPDEDLSASEESSDSGSNVSLPENILESLDAFDITPTSASHQEIWAAEALNNARPENQIERSPESLDASNISFPGSSISSEFCERESSAVAENLNGSVAAPADPVEDAPEEKHTKRKKKKGICGFFRRTWKAVKRPFARSRKTKVRPIVPPLRPDASNPEPTSVSNGIPGPSGFEPNEGKLESYYVFGKMLGAESFGTVLKATRRSDRQKVAIKFIRKRKKDPYVLIPGHSTPLPTELALMHMMRTPAISSGVRQMIEWFESPECINIVMEYAKPSISLTRYIQWYYTLKESTACILLRQAAQALQDCIDHGVFHCNVHSGNLLVNPDTLDLKLIDFRCGLLLDNAGYKRNQYNGASHCSPPELKNNLVFHAVPTNVWQLGLVLHEMVVSQSEESSSEDSDLTKECADVMRQCLTHDPAERPTLQQILQHKWFDCD